MVEISEAENTQRIIKIFDDISKRIREEREKVEHGYAHSSPFWNGYATALYNIQETVTFWKNEEEAALTDALTPADDSFNPDAEITRLRDLRCDLARLLIDNSTGHMLPVDIATGIEAANDLIGALEGISIGLMSKDQLTQNKSEEDDTNGD